MKQEPAYNPLDKIRLGESVAKAILQREVEPLPPPEAFVGAGVYAIYYLGDFAPYRAIAERNRTGEFLQPIYVGKAVPPGARRGGFRLGVDPGRALYNRLNEHAESIRQVRSLSLSDFTCRYMVVDDIWIPLGEALLIQWFTPVWNTVIDGFGNHDPGSGRYNQQRSPWDMVHPGRSWAMRCRENSRTRDAILAELAEALRVREH